MSDSTYCGRSAGASAFRPFQTFIMLRSGRPLIDPTRVDVSMRQNLVVRVAHVP